ncbi:MAG: histidine phosphatase family protein, partial [Phycisphaerales bacterium]|nr:histidine phosphatase family protein [Phycisphaerales bacterium]
KACKEFSELNLGLWEGVLRSDLETRFPSVYSQWIDQPGTVAPPDGESLETVQGRVLEQLFKGLLKLRSDHPMVGLVLRPYAWAVLKCWIDQRPLSEVWEYLEMTSSIESFSLDRSIVEQNRTQKSKIA